MITIQKNDDGKWEWWRVDENAEEQVVGPFDTIAECKADIKRRGLDEEPVVKLGEGEDINDENRGRADVDYIVTLGELEQFGINSVLGEIRSVDPRSINWHLTELIEQKLVEKSNALDLLIVLTGFSLALDDPDDPFKPVFVGADGTRTLVPLDFKKAQIDVIAEFAQTVNNPGLRARLADVCWFMRKDPDMAEIAIHAYCESVEKVRKSEAVFFDESSLGDSFRDASALGINAKDMMTRAAQIFNATRWKPETSQRFELLLTNLLEDAERKEEPLYSNDLKGIKAEMNSLIANSPTSRIAPAFDFGDDGLLHIDSPPDLQDVTNDDKVLEELKIVKDNLKQALHGTNEYVYLLKVVNQYDEVFSDGQISISFLYARGIRLENAIRATRRNIELGECTSFSAVMEENINSLLELHGAYIMSQKEGRARLEDAAAYRQSPQQIETIKATAEKLNDSVAKNTILFGEDVKKEVADAVQDIGKGTHPERSNQVATTVFIALTTSLVVSAFEASIPGSSLTTLVAGTIDAIWYFLLNAIPLLKIVVGSVASHASWIASLSNLLDRVKSLLNLRG